MIRSIKYLGAYIIPVLVFVGLYKGGAWSYSAVLFSFLFVPIVELFFSGSTDNDADDVKKNMASKKIFDVLLYINIPLVYGGLICLFYRLPSFSAVELIGQVLSVGVLLGANGINVGHELGHRFTKHEPFMAKLLLLPSFYMHFFIEHNRGHHKHVATPEDPSTARLNESIYAFWFRSVIYSYISAWQLEFIDLERRKHKKISIHNQMIWFLGCQLAYVIIVFFVFGKLAFLVSILAGIVGLLLLETINYIEHYGLLRKKNEKGLYEHVNSSHSWNSNHQMGRIVLYELTRHSDHHYRAYKKYQTLDHHNEAPQLPFGYPTAMLLSLVPPLWFYIMNKKVGALRA